MVLLAVGVGVAAIGGLAVVLMGGKKKGPVCTCILPSTAVRPKPACAYFNGIVMQDEKATRNHGERAEDECAGVPGQNSPNSASSRKDPAFARHILVPLRAAHAKSRPRLASREALQGLLWQKAESVCRGWQYDILWSHVH